MKAWSRAQHAQEREAGLYAHHQAEAELISSYLNSKEAVEAAVAAVSSAQHSQQPYGVPIPPPIPPCGAGGEYLDHEQPLPPQRSSSAAASRSRGKRSRHAGTSARNTGDIHYPKYDLGGYHQEQQYKYKNPECQYTTKYGEDCHFATSASSKHGGGPPQQSSSASCGYNKTWPKQHCTEEFEDHQYLMQDQPPPQQQQQQPPRSKKSRSKHRDRSPQQPQQQQQQQQQLDYPCFSSREREYLVTTGSTRHYETQKAANDPIPAIEEVGRYIEQAENRAKSVKDIARDLAKDRAALAAQHDGHPGAEVCSGLIPPESKPELAAVDQQPSMNPEIIPPPPSMDSSAVAGIPSQQQVNPNLQTFNPQASTKPEVQLQQEHVQYVDNECCQVAVGVSNATSAANHPTSEAVNATSAATMPRSRPGGPQQSATLKKTGTLTAQQMAQFGTLERNMAEVAERSRSARAELQNQNTLDRRSNYGASCDTCDAPLTPASLAGIDHRDLEHRPLTRSVTRATMYDEPPER